MKWRAGPLVLWAWVWPSWALAQARVVPDRPSCDSCRISIRQAVEFGAADDEGIVMSRWVAVHSLRDGRWASTEVTDPGAIRFYGSSGEFTHRIDAMGEGPGELKGVHDVFRDPEGYLVYDISLSRLTWVAEDFMYRRSERFPIQALRMARLADGYLAINAVTGRSGRTGDLVHVVSSRGEVRSSLGGDGPVDFSEGSHVRHRLVAVDSRDRIWIAPPNRYEIRSFDGQGRQLSVVRRDASWFRPHSNTGTPFEVHEGPPNPQVRDLVVDDTGVLWVLLWVADGEWESAIREMEDPAVGPERNRLFDSVVEALDAESGSLLARTRVDEALNDVSMAEDLGAGALFYRVVQETTGFISVGVLEFTLVR